MNVDKLEADRARRPPPPRLAPPGSVAPTFPGALNLEYVLAMDERVREVVRILRERNSVLILNPEKLEAQEEEAAAELYAALQEVSRCKACEEEAERVYLRAQDEIYGQERESSLVALGQWKTWDNWNKRKGPEWESVKAWEKAKEVYDRKQAQLGLKNVTAATKVNTEAWLAANRLAPRPVDPPEPDRPATVPESEVKVTNLRKSASMNPEVGRMHQAFLKAREERHQAEDYSTALQQKLALISGLQGARNHGL